MLVVSNISCSIMTLNLRPAHFLNLNGTDDFFLSMPFCWNQWTWPCLLLSLFNRGCSDYMQVCCILYFVCRISLSVIYIYIYLLLLWYFSHDICSFVYVDMEGHWTLQKRMAVCFQLKMRLPDLIFAALYQYLLVWSTLGRFVSCLHLMFLFLWTHLHGTFLSIFFNCSVWLSNFGNHNPLY